MIHRLLATCTVTDLDRAEEWYTRLLARPVDARPMAGLIEWHLADTFGVQVFADPARAGRSSMVLEETDLDTVAARLLEVGIAHDGAQPGGGARILPLTDPDGNQVVFTGA